MSSSKLCRRISEDLISNVPDNVADEILKRLPIHMAARTSVVSKQWKRNWQFLSKLSFDDDFWGKFEKEDGSLYWEECSHIISSILTNLGDRPIQEFILEIPQDFSFTIDPWLSVLARKAVKEIEIFSYSKIDQTLGSQIYRCSELVYLQLLDLTLKPPPFDFKGFPKLKELVFVGITISEPEIINRLIANCHQLTTLTILSCTGMDHIVVDVPSLRTLTISGSLKSLAFKNGRSLESIEVRLSSTNQFVTATETVKDGQFSKFLAAGGITRSLPVAFNHLKQLCLEYIELEYVRVFSYVLGMIESCPYVEELEILVAESLNNTDVGEHNVDYNKNLKLKHLRKITFKEITGSSPELQLVEYLLAISPVLQVFWLDFCNHAEELKNLIIKLLGFKRASPEARLLPLRPFDWKQPGRL